MVRFAFTLIELIFAIVVIGISVISIPTMNQVTTDGIEGNLVQEAIFAASTELNQAMSANWDENSYEPDSEDSLTRVIDLDSDCNNTASSARYRLKSGHILQPYHRRCLNNPATSIAGTNTDDDVSAFEDMAKTNSALTGTDTDASVGYKSGFTTSISVQTNATFDGVADQNIKRITATIKDGTEEITSLVTYSCNIGEVDYYKREY